MRQSVIIRNTRETQIKVTLDVFGRGRYDVQTECGFMKHMLELFTRHGRFNLQILCEGDSYVDYHHTVEDLGIALGEAFLQALGDKKGITRYGNMMLPMDEALVLVSLDISGRSCVVFDVELPSERVGDFDTELVKEFFYGFSRAMGLTVHVRQLAGENTHHIIEAVFKAFARALSKACAIDEEFADEIPSTKGLL